MPEYIVKVGTEDAVKPTVIAELIRCKDCKHRYKDGFGSGYVCTYHVCSFGVNDEDYCSFGERKDGNGNAR